MLKIAVIGAGSVRCSPAVIASLANYYGERQLEVRLFDADEERLDLFDRFARVCFASGQAPHDVVATSDIEEALEGVHGAIVQIGYNCARQFLKSAEGDVVSQAMGPLLQPLPPTAKVLSLFGERVVLPVENYDSIDWPAEPDEDMRRAMPHQLLRWIRQEEYLHDYLKEFLNSPVKEWLDESKWVDAE